MEILQWASCAWNVVFLRDCCSKGGVKGTGMTEFAVMTSRRHWLQHCSHWLGDSVCSHNVQLSFCDRCVSFSRSTHVVGVFKMLVLSPFCAGTLCPLSHVPSPQRPLSHIILSCLWFVIDLQVRAKWNRIFFPAGLVYKFVFILVLQFLHAAAVFLSHLPDARVCREA